MSQASRQLAWVLIFVLGWTFPGLVLAQEISWRSDLNKAKIEAQEKGKPLLLDFGTEQCFWCKKMDQTTFRDRTIADKITRSFVPVKVDANQNLDFTLSMGVRSYPTLVVLSPQGKKQSLREGYTQAAELNAWLDTTIGNVHGVSDAGAFSAGTGPVRATVITRSTAPPVGFFEVPADPNAEAAQMLKKARDDYQALMLLSAWEKCLLIQERFAQSAEAVQARDLARVVRAHPKWRSLMDRLEIDSGGR